MLEISWKACLFEEFKKDYMIRLRDFLIKERLSKIIYPKSSDVFAALKITPLNEVKVVIIGQDPYPGKNQAHGLSFSVYPNEKIPPTLKNIFKELYDDLNIVPCQSGYLRKWADQGILLLNSVLTVEHGFSNSHVNIGWEIFTDRVIKVVSENLKFVIFVLWGKNARKKIHCIDVSKHIIISSSHPSPYSASNGFFGSKPFSRINFNLKKFGLKEINWNLNL